MASMHPARQKIIALTKSILVVQGCLAIAFGLAAMLWPGLTVLVLAYLFAVFFIADGCIMLAVSLAWGGRAAGIRLLWGLLQILVGLFILYNPEVSFAVLVVVLGLSLIMRGVFSLMHAVTHKAEPAGERVMHGVLGALGVIVGLVVVFQPAAGGLAFVWVLGLYAVIAGSLLVGLALGAGKPRRKRA